MTSERFDHTKIEQGVRLLLEGIGEDPERPGLRETPSRVARASAARASSAPACNKKKGGGHECPRLFASRRSQAAHGIAA